MQCAFGSARPYPQVTTFGEMDFGTLSPFTDGSRHLVVRQLVSAPVSVTVPPAPAVAELSVFTWCAFLRGEWRVGGSVLNGGWVR